MYVCIPVSTVNMCISKYLDISIICIRNIILYTFPNGRRAHTNTTWNAFSIPKMTALCFLLDDTLSSFYRHVSSRGGLGISLTPVQTKNVHVQSKRKWILCFVVV
jgi:hypothetical protein